MENLNDLRLSLEISLNVKFMDRLCLCRQFCGKCDRIDHLLRNLAEGATLTINDGCWRDMDHGKKTPRSNGLPQQG